MRIIQTFFLTTVLLVGFSLPLAAADYTNQAASMEWTPPQNPDPQKILNEAEMDTRAGQYTNALAKQVWFFQNALKYDPAQYGVRLSFALSDWVELGKVYPPALEKLKAFQNAAETNVHKQTNVRENFHDFASINKELNEDSKTVDLFVWLDSNQPDSAKTVFDLARPSLVKSKQYTLLGKYIQPPYPLFDKAVQLYEKNMQNTKLAKDPGFAKRIQDFAEQKFINDTTTLIALLVVNDRKADAQQIAEKNKKRIKLSKI